MLSMGASQPWPEAMYALTGQRTMDASPIIDYFQPLMGWLQEQNKGRQCGLRQCLCRNRGANLIEEIQCWTCCWLVRFYPKP